MKILIPTNHHWYLVKNTMVENMTPLRPSGTTKIGKIQAMHAKPEVNIVMYLVI
jgi:hypothetical protein